MTNRRHLKGFTLIEAIMTLAIASILATVAIPSFLEYVEINRAQTRASQFIGGLMYARSEAVKRSAPVTICRSANSTACPNGSNWEDGWIIFSDDDGDGAIDAGVDVILKVVNDTSGSGFTLRGGGNTADSITYNADGGTSDSGSLRLCPVSGDVDHSRDLFISQAGRPRTAELAGGSSCPS